MTQTLPDCIGALAAAAHGLPPEAHGPVLTLLLVLLALAAVGIGAACIARAYLDDMDAPVLPAPARLQPLTVARRLDISTLHDEVPRFVDINGGERG